MTLDTPGPAAEAAPAAAAAEGPEPAEPGKRRKLLYVTLPGCPAEYVDGWNAVMRPAGMTSQDLASLRKIISEVR